MGIAEKITYLRKKNNWSQEQLAGKLDVSRQAIYKWEANISLPEIDKLKKLSKIFGVSYDQLLDDDIDIIEKEVKKPDNLNTTIPVVIDAEVEHEKTEKTDGTTKEKTDNETVKTLKPDGVDIKISTDTVKTDIKKGTDGAKLKEKTPAPKKNNSPWVIVLVVGLFILSVTLGYLAVKLGLSYLFGVVDSEGTVSSEEILISDNAQAGVPDTQEGPFTVKFFTYGETVIADRRVPKDGLITLEAEPKKAGYKFLHWSDNTGEKWDLTKDRVTGDMSLYALYEKKDVKIILNKNDGSGEVYEINAKYDDKITLPDCPFERVGYDFFIWTDLENRCAYEDGSVYEVGANDTYTLYADWTLLFYNIVYDYNYDIPNPVVSMNYTVEDLVSMPSPEREHYNFMGWYSRDNDSIVTEIPAGTTGGISLYARWELKRYNIYYDLNWQDTYTEQDVNNKPNITNSNPTEYTANDLIILKSPKLTYANEPKVSIVFAGWYADEKLSIPAECITYGSGGDKHFYAKWERSTYAIRYILDGGVNNEQNKNKYKSGDAFALEAPTREFYNFKGWYTESTFENEIKEITPDNKGTLTLYAKWEHIGYELRERASGTQYMLVRYTGNGEHVEIPSSYNGKSITAIAEGAFKDCKSIISLKIPKTVDFIGKEAFMNMTSLKEITLASVNVIYERTFANCTSLEKINNGASAQSIFTEAYLNCKSLTEISISVAAIRIEPDAFNGCESVREYKIAGVGEGAYKIVDKDLYLGNRLFKYAVGKEESSFECSATTHYIGDYAFYGAKNLTSVKLPSELGGIGLSAFEGCTSLEAIELGQTVNFIDARAFYECTSLKEVAVSHELSSLGNYAFYGCENLEKIEIKQKIGEIGYKVFAECKSLEDITFNGADKISASLFEGCVSLKTVSLPDTITEIPTNLFYGCVSLAEAEIPSAVTKIGDGAFYGCTALTSIYISEGVVTIEGSPFAGCDNLKIACQSNKAPSSWSEKWSDGALSVEWSYVKE